MSPLKRVLLVDDNDELRHATRELLEEQGFEVMAAARGEEAVELFESTQKPAFDLVITDFSMPGLSGIELSDRLLAGNGRLPVLLISGDSGNADLRRRLVAGDLAFLAKPFSSGELAAKITEARVLALGRGTASSRPMNDREPHTSSLADPQRAASRSPRRKTMRVERSRAFSASPLLQLAAMAILVLGLGVIWRNLELGAPSLPAPGPDTTLRSTSIETLGPVGNVSEPPAEWRWRAVSGAHGYSVSLRAVDETVLWQAEVPSSPISLPPEVSERLHRAVTYFWSVEALDEQGRIRASSGPVRFTIDLVQPPSTRSNQP